MFLLTKSLFKSSPLLLFYVKSATGALCAVLRDQACAVLRDQTCAVLRGQTCAVLRDRTCDVFFKNRRVWDPGNSKKQRKYIIKNI